MDSGKKRAFPSEQDKISTFAILAQHYQFSSVQLLSRVQLFATPCIAARQASLSITNSQSSLRLTSIESVMPSSHLILCRPLLLLPPVPPSIRVFFPMAQRDVGLQKLHARWNVQFTKVVVLYDKEKIWNSPIFSTEWKITLFIIFRISLALHVIV